MISHNTTLSSSLKLTFSFLDFRTTQKCRLVSKEWKEHVEIYYQLRELKIYKDLHKFCSVDLSEVTPEDLDQINQIISGVSKSLFFLKKSTLSNYPFVCDYFQAYNRPNQKTPQLVTAYMALVSTEEEWRTKTDYRRVEYFIYEKSSPPFLRDLREGAFLTTITNEKIELSQKYIDNDLLKPSQIMRFGGEYWALWIFTILDCAKRRLSLNENSRKILDEINMKTPREVKEELAKVHRLKQIAGLEKVRDKFNKEVRKHEERIESLGQKVKQKDLEIEVLKLAVDNLKYLVKDLKK